MATRAEFETAFEGAAGYSPITFTTIYFDAANSRGFNPLGPHGVATGAGPFVYTAPAGSSVPTGLVSGSEYYVIAISADFFQFADTYEDALAGVAIAMTAYTPAVVTFTDLGDVVNLTAHGLTTGDGPFELTTTGALPTGLAVDTAYWVIEGANANSLQLAASAADAGTATEVTFTGTGTGTHSLVEMGSAGISGNGTTLSVAAERTFLSALDNGNRVSSDLAGAVARAATATDSWVDVSQITAAAALKAAIAAGVQDARANANRVSLKDPLLARFWAALIAAL